MYQKWRGVHTFTAQLCDCCFHRFPICTQSWRPTFCLPQRRRLAVGIAFATSSCDEMEICVAHTLTSESVLPPLAAATTNTTHALGGPHPCAPLHLVWISQLGDIQLPPPRPASARFHDRLHVTTNRHIMQVFHWVVFERKPPSLWGAATLRHVRGPCCTRLVLARGQCVRWTLCGTRYGWGKWTGPSS